MPMGKWHKGRIRGFFRDGKRKVDLQLKQLADSGRPLDMAYSVSSAAVVWNVKSIITSAGPV